MAGGLQRNLDLALRRRVNPAGFAGREVFDAPSARMASHRMARRRKRADEILAFDPARRHAHRRSRRHGQIALASSATTRNSKANSASPISKGEAGAASIITQPCASPLMVSSSANERRFPPQAPGDAEHLAYPPVPDPEAPPIRPERHIENSIATIRRQLTVALARTLMRCPCCHALSARPPMPPRPPYRGSS